MVQNILDILEEPGMTKICAPMVRYSKLQFRSLVRRYDCDICFTPMIMANSFVQSPKARNSEFTTNEKDAPLIVQFAANEVDDFVNAAEIIAPYSNGVDLNCGCPQRWAMKDGYGAHLLTKPQLVKDLIYQVRNRISQPFTVSVKIRILQDIKKTVELCQTIERAGASFLTVHARTPQMRNVPIDMEGLKLARDSVRLPVIANGNVKTLKDAEILCKESKCNGVMSANGLLTNPALFSGYLKTPLSCVQEWLDITASIPTQFLCMHHHLVFMLEKILTKQEKVVFNELNSREAVLEFLENRYGITPKINCEKYKLNYVTNYAELSSELPKKCIKVDSNVDDEHSSLCLENLFLN